MNNAELIINFLNEVKQHVRNSLWRILIGVFSVKLVLVSDGWFKVENLCPRNQASYKREA